MTDPPRLVDDSDNPLIVGMLSAARRQSPPPSSLNSTLIAIGTAVSVLGGHASAGAAGAAGAAGTGLAATSLVKLAVKWTVLSVVVVGGGVATVEVAPSLLEEAPPGHAHVH